MTTTTNAAPFQLQPPWHPSCDGARMQQLIDAVLRLGSEHVATEEAACDALAALRFPNGIVCHRCRSTCTRELAHVTCAREHRFTILVGTPFGSKLRPRIRALFLAIRAFAVSPRSIPARELARDVGAPHATLWRHLHTLRALMPAPSAHPTSVASRVQLCGRHTRVQPGWVRAGARCAIARELVPSIEGGNAERMIGESVRTLLNGTFRGVSADWLCAYLDEARLRWRVRGFAATLLVEGLLRASLPLTFDNVREHFNANI